MRKGQRAGKGEVLSPLDLLSKRKHVMPTELKESKPVFAFHSSKRARRQAPALVAEFTRRHQRANCQAGRRAKNIRDAKARDFLIKERAAKKARDAGKQPARAIKPVIEAA